jgi:16S rRNA (uracil1498-N3)-methyltransferase
VSRPLFLVESIDYAVLEGPEGHHAADVMRLRVGEELLLSDGRGRMAAAVVQAVGRGRLDLTVFDEWYAQRPAPRLVVAQGIAKGDRGELAVQAMTEVGVDEIVPWAAARSVARWRDDRPLQRWRSVAREAAKQARRAWLPEVSPVSSTGALAPRVTFVLHEEATERLSTVSLPALPELVIAVGPEGGVAPEELAAFEAAGAVPVRLGDTVLRTSTAGVAALAVLSARLSRW